MYTLKFKGASFKGKQEYVQRANVLKILETLLLEMGATEVTIEVEQDEEDR